MARSWKSRLKDANVDLIARDLLLYEAKRGRDKQPWRELRKDTHTPKILAELRRQIPGLNARGVNALRAIIDEQRQEVNYLGRYKAKEVPKPTAGKEKPSDLYTIETVITYKSNRGSIRYWRGYFTNQTDYTHKHIFDLVKQEEEEGTLSINRPRSKPQPGDDLEKWKAIKVVILDIIKQ